MSQTERPSPGDEEDPTTDPALDAPRREASARFDVAETASQQAAMRHAMDPANESLAEALRLSYRVLQVAILVLVVVFCFSGFQSVSEGQTGVKTMFGAIVGEPGDQQLQPGLQPFWPYPVGEILLVDQKRMVELRQEYWIKLRPGQTTLEQATDSSSPGDVLIPSLDAGSVLMADGDLAHLQVVAEYTVDDAVRLLEEVNPVQMDALVRSVLMRAVVQTAARFTLAEFLETRDQPAMELRTLAQQALDQLKCGIQITNVVIPQKIAPLPVRKNYQKVQEAREKAKIRIANAQQEANRTLVSAAGPQYARLLSLIEDYESELTRGDLAAADAAMQRVGAMLESPEAAGEVAQTISRAQAYESALTARLANDAKRVEGLRASFRENPTQLVRQLWLDTVHSVLDNTLVEVFSTRGGFTPVRLGIVSSPEVMRERQRAELEFRKQQASMPEAGWRATQLGTEDIMVNKPGRRLRRDAQSATGR